MEVNGVELSSIGGVDTVDCGRCGVAECGNQGDGVEIFSADHLGIGGIKNLSALFPNEMATSLVKKRGPTRKATHTVPNGIFSRSPAEGAPLLQVYLDKLPENERYSVFASLIQTHWKWLCKAAPYLKFPEPKPIPDGKVINIGIRIYRMTISGAQRAMQQFANCLAVDPRYHVTIFIDKKWANRIDYSLHANVSLAEVTPRNGCIDLDGYMQDYPQDLFIFPESWRLRNIQNILLSKFVGTPIIAEEQDFAFRKWEFFKNLHEKFELLGRLYSTCNALTCPSCVDLYQWRKAGVKNSIIRHNPSAFDPNMVTTQQPETKNILWVGHLDWRQKRPIMAVEAFAKVLEQEPDARLIMLGDYNQKSARSKECKQFIEKHGIGHAVEILGFQKDIASYYANSALLVSTSLTEGSCNAFTEAKSFGRPVVATELPYLEKLQKGCIQTPRNDVDALAKAIIDLLKNPEKRQMLGEEGRLDVIKNFSSEVVHGQYEALIQAILHGGSNAVEDFCAKYSPATEETAEKILAEEVKFLTFLA
jgi:glycosyltransferase involved in cell wall biosynthesis